MSDVSWTLQELSEHVEAELERRGIQAPGGRVAAVPNARTIRYYTTLGLVDKPSAYEGGVARYGQRHLLQLLAIKALQTAFLPLPQIQKRLLGRSDAELLKLVENAPPPPPPAAADTWKVRAVAPGVSVVVQDERQFLEWARQAGGAELLARLQRAVGDMLG